MELHETTYVPMAIYKVCMVWVPTGSSKMTARQKLQKPSWVVYIWVISYMATTIKKWLLFLSSSTNEQYVRKSLLFWNSVRASRFRCLGFCPCATCFCLHGWRWEGRVLGKRTIWLEGWKFSRDYKPLCSQTLLLQSLRTRDGGRFVLPSVTTTTSGHLIILHISGLEQRAPDFVFFFFYPAKGLDLRLMM